MRLLHFFLFGHPHKFTCVLHTHRQTPSLEIYPTPSSGGYADRDLDASLACPSCLLIELGQRDPICMQSLKGSRESSDTRTHPQKQLLIKSIYIHTHDTQDLLNGGRFTNSDAASSSTQPLSSSPPNPQQQQQQQAPKPQAPQPSSSPP